MILIHIPQAYSMVELKGLRPTEIAGKEQDTFRKPILNVGLKRKKMWVSIANNNNLKN